MKRGNFHMTERKVKKKKKKNYHSLCSPVEVNGVMHWKCDYCGAVEKQPLQDGCPHVYPPCEHCEGSPDSNECAADCGGIGELLASEGVYLAGFGEEQ